MSRISFNKVKDVIEMPNLIENQIKSFDYLKNVGMDEVLRKMFPISDHNGTYEMEYVSVKLEKPTMTVEEAKMKRLTYSAPLKARFRLINKDIGDVTEQEVFMGDFPYMTDQGTIVYNGNERVVVAQIVRSPGIYFDRTVNERGKNTYEAKIIPSKGVWISFGIDSKGLVWVKIDNGRKVSVVTFLKALGIGDNRAILETFNNNQFILNTLEKEETMTEEEAMIELYKKIRPNDPPVLERAKNYIEGLFFDQRKYDLAPVGRYKMNRKLSLAQRVLKKPLAKDVEGFKAGTIIDDDLLNSLEKYELFIENKDGKIVKVIGNGLPKERHLTIGDFVAAINYLVSLEDKVGDIDNIDHLANRRIRLAGELLLERFEVGMTRVEKFIRERMNVNQTNLDSEETLTPQSLINIRPLVSAIKEFLGSGALSQYIDQINPLAELTHKRRISALGPGGFSKDRAGVEVRDVHFSHYGRICPIETPEGFGVGLINSLSIFSRVNEYGFLETPYRKVDRKTNKVTDEIVYMTADFEEKYYIAQASDVDNDGNFKKEFLTVRYGKEYPVVPAKDVDYVDVSAKQVVGIGASLIPFLENDDANRAVMGANMQRQGVPLLKPEEPWVATGIEKKVAEDTKSSYVAEDSGIIEDIKEKEIIVKYDSLGEKRYLLNKFVRSNASTCFNHYVRVTKGQRIEKGDVLADSMSTNNGELALGQNVIVAFMPWNGYNYEDAILLNERLVKEDVYTTISISEFSIEVRETKLGREEITREIPNTGEKQRRNLDENGIIRIGTKVGSEDILVGKVTPKSQEDTTPQERLLKAIFAEKVKEFKDNSLRMPHGKEGVVIDVVRLTKDEAELPKGVTEEIKVFVAEKRKILIGDKMAGRHGNKGVVSKILPVEDMPYLEDGTPVDICLNPLGVPSRMNIGQIMETHLGMVAKTLGIKFETPVFDGAKPEEIQKKLKEAGLPEDGKFTLYDGKTGEPFENPVTVGVMYMLKLNHQVKDKLHARSTGPYSLVTQQPLGGKAQMGGQRFGEMEVWALEAHGAAYALQEMLTLKSDDVFGRAKLFEAIVKGLEFPEPNMTESFKVLINEIRGLGLNIDVISKNGDSLVDRKKKKPRSDIRQFLNDEENDGLEDFDEIDKEILDEE